MPIRQDLSPYEHHMRAFLARTGTDLDAQAAVFNLHHAAIDVIATMDSLSLRPHDLTHAGFVVLMMIWITGPRETRELAAVVGVTRGAIVGSVNTLEKRGLVRRLRSDIDRRLVTVELTDSGLDLVMQVQKDWHALEVEVTRLTGIYWKPETAELVFNFECRVVSGTPGTSDEADEVRYFALDALPPNTAPKQVQRIRDAVAGDAVAMRVQTGPGIRDLLARRPDA